MTLFFPISSITHAKFVSQFFFATSFFPSPPSVLQNDANCDCYQTGDGYAKDARFNSPSSLVVSPDGTLYVADLGNIRIRAIRRNQPPTGMYRIQYKNILHFYLSFWQGENMS